MPTLGLKRDGESTLNVEPFPPFAMKEIPGINSPMIHLSSISLKIPASSGDYSLKYESLEFVF